MFIYLLLFILTTFYPSNVSAETPTVTLATASPQVRNRLQLLSNLPALNERFNRFHARLSVLINRLRKINLRLERRLSKLDAKKNITDRSKNQLTAISANLDKAEKELLAVSDLWSAIMNNKSRDEFQALKKRLADLLVALENIASEEKNLVKEMKKYKAKVQPTVKVTTNSAVIN
ncbi:hypothetical protein A3D78_07240 [Candidatus Gottesmanbacteria bacterium RIFCSPHIGHO2_02_FULL_39_14]|uniref:DUF5667 domain-containing protein n=2 Tax=Candidatus Gottesmaniibacteriota TaxID=1752720 RepID=A0A1F5ZZP2_9BACT|nr:MAG: hypothetical protein A3D78_07240 [Candidatus Gottesmanbacteria bacterium RIFCSPHIGHO2_02_FULL_39_14]OGG32324.1 MAG: hypothetical protein A3I51_02035 [Candidatus Gottesmanbacteria bacterium RIFCSPLOWO2_02_FULL_38_8]